MSEPSKCDETIPGKREQYVQGQREPKHVLNGWSIEKKEESVNL